MAEEKGSEKELFCGWAQRQAVSEAAPADSTALQTSSSGRNKQLGFLVFTQMASNLDYIN